MGSEMAIPDFKPRATAAGMAERISADLCEALLRLRTRRLAQDIMGRYRCKRGTAMHAVALARVRLGVERRHGQ